MRPLCLFVAAALAVAACVPADAQAYRTAASRQNAVTATAAPDAAVSEELGGIPLDSAGRWHCTLFVGSDGQSRALEAAFQSDPYLRAIAGWANYNVYRTSQASQAERFRAFGVGSVPYVCIYPPIGTPYYFRAAEATGYEGDGQRLARDLLDQLAEFRGRHCPDGTCPAQDDPPPNVNLPQINVDVAPLPTVIKLPSDGGEKQADAELGDFPDYPQIAIVIDPNGLGEELKAAGLELIARQVRERFPEATGAKAVIVRLGTPQAKAYPVAADDTPALFITSRKRIVGYLNAGMIAVLRDHLELPTPAAEPSETQQLAAEIRTLAETTLQQEPSDEGFSLAAVVAAATSSGLGIAIVAIVVICLLWWRSRKVAGAAAGDVHELLAGAVAKALAAGGQFVRGPKKEEPTK